MKLLRTLGAFLMSGIVNAAPLHNIVVFGDSLSDNGNLYEIMKKQLPQSPPYYQGRFSNGPVWVEYVTASYFPHTASTHLLDYAIGGAGVSEEDDEDEVLFTLGKQINTYLVSHHDKANPDDLYIVWIGANNYLGSPAEAEKILTDVNTGIVHSVERLVSKGAKHILLFNLPDLGKTPAAVEFDAEESMSYFALQHNARLFESYKQLKEQYPEVEWLFFDLGAIFTDVIEHPTENGFINVSSTCSISEPDELSKKSFLKMVAQVKPRVGVDPCEGYLFFDLVHPTGFAHKLIGNKIRTLLDEAGIEFRE